MLALTLCILLVAKDFETIFPVRKVMRDSTATVIAVGTGKQRRLLVNGMGMTELSPITKMMAHMTLASLDHAPRHALVICFGMGTTFRAAASWNIPTTSVELVPSVPRLFSFFHADAAQVMALPNDKVVIDDGRRYLERNPEKYDAIILDPPPPVETAGSSLLYSQDFYTVAKQRLEPGGILQQWLPDADLPTQAAVARALKNSFPYIRVFHNFEGEGWHFLASERPIPARSAAELVARMPQAAIADMMEWGPAPTPEQQMNLLLDHQKTIDDIIALSPQTLALTDDRPINEYFFLRKVFVK
jgi:spermidine synthase